MLRGDMSIVGPRPEDWDLVQRHYTREHMRSLATRPGIACTAEYLWYPDLTHHDPAPPGVSAQAHYVARHLPLQATAGARYVDRQSFGYDLWILARTAFCVLVHCWRPPARRPLPPLPATTRDAAGAIAP